MAAPPDQPQDAPSPALEADDEASSIGGTSTSDEESRASLRSTILDYRRENGRTYHRLSDGKYYFPNDEQEQDRLDLVNHLWTVTLDGAFCLNPKNAGANRVLDIGTGTGAWALDYADAHPDAQVIGVDLSPIQPGYTPSNCIFEIDDVEKDWTWTRPFDLILARNMGGSFADWPRLVEQAYEHLEPGGYFEIQDSLWPAVSDDGTLKKDSALYEWAHMMNDGAAKIGRRLDITDRHDELLRAAGFENVQKTSLRFPVSPWPKDPKLRELGTWTQASLLPGLEGMSLALCTRLLDWSRAETLVFCAQVRRELKDTNIHAYWNGYIIHGRKPFETED
ncbi:Secondary metabolism regulator LAE1 [Colletotrichum orbiculare MAFF 240422]|uniref:Secondary metabolism regulator LAE1 n=1 Tax=Colletotrichum orbiculare (strain 104-T / ATCC 96160 / CBS 514.97 / LARS 414 / MAFF 240422) TaxID=1213857 RepID=N4VD38_COLOR|nr:Secondary metabolism regulator LAE1 [Colletotrichum orbiculare MAFF 240422]